MGDAIGFKVEVGGPVFDGRMAKQVETATEKASKAVADEGMRLVKQRLGRSFKEPTGAYLSSVLVDRSVEGFAVTGDAVYGPWLEGTGSRNDRSRFKGYAAFRRAKDELDKSSETIAGPIVRRAT